RICELNCIDNKDHIIEEKEALELFKDDVIEASKKKKMEEFIEELHFIYSVGETLLSYIERNAMIRGKTVKELSEDEIMRMIDEYVITMDGYGLEVKDEVAYLMGTKNHTNTFKKLPTPKRKR
ncbi:hypothetical protein, partial [Desulfurobacterium sp.]|uniref:hypothetical protein n=1 Tax=Desulfurobacterium sp. TaxID=2004706 RepID=UPI00261072FB